MKNFLGILAALVYMYCTFKQISATENAGIQTLHFIYLPTQGVYKLYDRPSYAQVLTFLLRITQEYNRCKGSKEKGEHKILRIYSKQIGILGIPPLY